MARLKGPARKPRPKTFRGYLMLLREWIAAVFSAHRCYMGVPHRNKEGHIVITCYQCGRTKRMPILEEEEEE